MQILDGKAYALELMNSLTKKVSNMSMKPHLVTILVGDDPSSKKYVEMKIKAGEKIGIRVTFLNLNSNLTTKDIILKIEELNKDKDVNGIMIQHPLPSHIDEDKCFNSININKDVDGLNALTFSKLALNKSPFYPATPLGIIDLLKHYNISLNDKHIVIIGRSRILGKPLAMMLLNENATVTICHSFTKNLKSITKQADILISAIGKPFFVTPDFIKNNVILIDAGYKDNKGDIDPKCYEKSSFYTPTPGGIGPMTIVKLLEQVVVSSEKEKSNEHN